MGASIYDNDLRQACREVMADPEVRSRYPEGMTSGEVLAEIRHKKGDDAFPYVDILDVHDELTAIYGKPLDR